MRHLTNRLIIVCTALLLGLPLSAQTPPDGCTIPVPEFTGKQAVQDLLDDIFQQACDHHDLCFRECLGPRALGFPGHYHACNLALLGELTAWCGSQTAIQAAIDGGVDPVVFGGACEAAMLVIYGVEESSTGWSAYRKDQCPFPSPYSGCQPVNDACCYFYPGPAICSGYCSLQDHLSEINECEVQLHGTWDWYECRCILPPCPVIINLGEGATQLTSAEEGVYFDLDADGEREGTAWTSPSHETAFLVLDRNGNGVVDDGAELFGDHTPQPESESKNGFAALAVFDSVEFGGNGDGLISPEDAIFATLRLWTDRNQDGESQPNEFSGLSSAGIVSIDLDYRESRRTDRYGNSYRYRAKTILSNGESRFAYDVFLARR